MSEFQGANITEGGGGFASLGAKTGSNLVSILNAEDIVPGANASYQLCKLLYLYHPLGAKIVEAPIRLAQSQPREITVPAGPETLLIPAFEREWATIGGKDVNGSDVSATALIRNLVSQSKVYGICTLIVGERGKQNQDAPMDLETIADADLYFNILDPLNTAGSLVFDQDPNSPDFQKARVIRVGTQLYHPSRCAVMMNEQPIYLAFTSSAFGFVGRSAYQRALYALKTFIQTMITDQYVAVKVGLLIATQKAPGPVINQRILNMFGFKRTQLQGGTTGNVLTIGMDEKIESLNFQNLEGPAKMVRDNALKNIAMAAGMPTKLLEMETMVGGMAEGTEDAKQIALFINDVRSETAPAYRFFDRIVMRRAWTREFYEIVRREIPDPYANMPYETAFTKWENSFDAKWPNLLEEPDSEKMKAEEVRFKAVSWVAEVMSPLLQDQDNKASLAAWVADEVNSKKELFSSDLELDYAAIRAFVPPTPMEGGEGGAKEPSPPSTSGSTT